MKTKAHLRGYIWYLSVTEIQALISVHERKQSYNQLLGLQIQNLETEIHLQ
jgi:hypothetical protein